MNTTSIAFGPALAGVHPAADIAAGAIADILVNNLEGRGEVALNPGDKMTFTSTIDVVRSTSSNSKASGGFSLDETSGGNGLRFSNSFSIVDSKGNVTYSNSTTNFLNLDPNNVDLHNSVMKQLESSKGGTNTVVTNPNYTPVLDFKLKRTN